MCPSPRTLSHVGNVEYVKEADGSVTPRRPDTDLPDRERVRSGSLGLIPEDLEDVKPGTLQEGITMSVGDVIDAAGYGNFQHFLMILCGSVWMADAMEMMLMSFLLPRVREDWKLTDVEEADIMTFTFLGMLVGAYAWGIFSDKYGRRKGYLATAAFTAVFGLASAACPNVIMLTICRFFVGLGLGGAPVAFSLFAEFVPTAQRGQTLVLLEGVFWTGGALFEAMLAWIILGSGFDWPWLLVVSAIPLCCICALYPKLPESPRWLVMTGQEDAAIAVLKQVGDRNSQFKPEGSPLPNNFNLVMPTEEESSNFCDLFSPELRVTTSLLWIIWCANVLTYYGIVLVIPMYFEGNGENEYMSAFVNTCAELPGLFCAVMLIDRAGRKMTQVYLFTEAAVCTLLMAWLSLPNSLLFLLAMGARMGYSGAFLATYVYTPEVYPTSVRTTGLGAASAMGRIAGMLTDHVAVLGHQDLRIPVIIYGVVACIAALASYSLPIETGGAQLSEGKASVQMLAMEQADEDTTAEVKTLGGEEFARLDGNDEDGHIENTENKPAME